MTVSRRKALPAVPAWHAGYLRILPAIQRTCRLAFRDLPEEAREEAVAEATAAALVSYLAMVRRGRSHLAIPSTMARYAIYRVRSGRRIAGTSVRDVCSRAGRQHHGLTTTSLDSRPAAWQEAVLCDTRQASVPDTVAFRLDFATWLERWAPRDRTIAELLVLGHSTGELARKFQVSPSRISRLRRRFHRSWKAYQDELVFRP